MASHYYFQISNTPVTLTRIIDCVRPERYDEALEEGRFTLREVIAHMADWEETVLDRITKAVEYPGSTIEPFDEEARAVQHHYKDKDVHHELEVFENRRRDTVSYLLGLAEDDWNKTMVHPELGTRTVLEHVQMVVGHDMYHVHQLSQYMK
jgi:uncharacterized damage-inducible protein DinB